MPIFKSDEFLLNILPKKRILGIDPGTKTLGIAISNSDLTVASPIFTIQIKKLQSDLNQLLEVLKKYAVENQVIDSKWDLVTGDKREIYDLARKSYLAAKDNSFGEYEMIHTENFVLIDKKKQIRGFYDGTNKEEIDRLYKDIKILKNSN